MTEQVNYSEITEAPGLLASAEQLERLFQRYHFAAGHTVPGGSVLELACGTGIGLGYLAAQARSVTGIDIDEANLQMARETCTGRKSVTVQRMDAHSLDFPDGTFDLVLLFEAVYYLKDPDSVLKEVRRVLRPYGRFVICSVNREWQDFHPSPYTVRYYSAQELRDRLRAQFGSVRMFGAFPVEQAGVRNRLVSLIKRAAVSLDLIPGSLRLRAYLKRIFLGKLVPLPREVYTDMTLYQAPVELTQSGSCKGYKIIYAVAEV